MSDGLAVLFLFWRWEVYWSGKRVSPEAFSLVGGREDLLVSEVKPLPPEPRGRWAVGLAADDLNLGELRRLVPFERSHDIFLFCR